MPIVQTLNVLPEVKIAIWKIEEKEDFFLQNNILTQNEQLALRAITHPERRLQSLAARYCLRHLVSIPSTVDIYNDMDTKHPFLSDHSHQISFSHSHDYIASIASKYYNVGVDVEKIDLLRDFSVARMFMSSDELLFFQSNPDPILFYLIWSAKETLYKLCPRTAQSGLSFRKHLQVSLANLNVDTEGNFETRICKNDYSCKVNVHFYIQKDLVCTYGILEK